MITEDQTKIVAIISDILMKFLWSLVLMGSYITLLIFTIRTLNPLLCGTTAVFSIAVLTALTHYFPKKQNTTKLKSPTKSKQNTTV